jgi:hypothetical protein
MWQVVVLARGEVRGEREREVERAGGRRQDGWLDLRFGIEKKMRVEVEVSDERAS